MPHEVDGSQGQFRAPRLVCLLKASNDYEAVQAFPARVHSHTARLRKEAERLILLAIVERGCTLSSLTTDDAITSRAFLRRPTPLERWVGAARSRQSVEWRPFSGPLSTRSAAHARTVLAALFRWAGRATLRPRQSVRGCQGARAHEDGSRCQPPLCRRRMAAAPHGRRWPRLVLRLERDGRTTPSIPAGFRVRDRPESQWLTGTTLGDVASASMAITGCTLSARAARLGRWRSRRWRVGHSTSIWRNAGRLSHVKNGAKRTPLIRRTLVGRGFRGERSQSA